VKIPRFPALPLDKKPFSISQVSPDFSDAPGKFLHVRLPLFYRQADWQLIPDTFNVHDGCASSQLSARLRSRKSYWYMIRIRLHKPALHSFIPGDEHSKNALKWQSYAGLVSTCSFY
jgi:hypothetical protein